VQVESYVSKETSTYTQGGSSGRHAAREPHIPLPFRQKLVEALKEVHAELLQPPEKIRDDEEKMSKWSPRVKREIDWNAVLEAHGGQVGHAVGGAIAPRSATTGIEESEEADIEPQHFTIGLIGALRLVISRYLFFLTPSQDNPTWENLPYSTLFVS
jgi:hypothetical protein